MYNIIGEGVRFFDKVRIIHDNGVEYEWREVSGNEIDIGVFPRVLQVDTQDGLHRLQYQAADCWMRDAFDCVTDTGFYIYDCFVRGYMSEHYYRNAASRAEIWRDQLFPLIRGIV